MNIAKMIKGIIKEVHGKEREDKQLHWALVQILDDLGSSNFDSDTAEIGWDDIMGTFNWGNDIGTDEQIAFAQKQAVSQLERVCKELRKLGFKCKAIGNRGKVNGSNGLWFQTPFITVDFK
jgi:hypothetical protein